MSDSTTRLPSSIAGDGDQELSYAMASDEDRCAPRHRLSISARMRFSGSSSFPVNVIDISVAGFACDALLVVRRGTLCWLTLPGLGALEAEVVWHDKKGMGCAFTNLLNRAVLDHYIAKYAVE
ncbi:PilZ domain-containing protein [Parasphingorhabdus sp.]|uniref:PilZ domain-containing protein n=1 Tax=Parasphingorhabdus sp. TaxID=2709688 RepID=UPI003264B5BE